MCDIQDPSVFDINKDVHEGELVLIDDISEDDVAPLPRGQVTPIKEPHAEEIKDRENVKPMD